MGAWAGGVAQGVTAKNAAKDQRKANAELTRRMEIARQAYMQRRPQVASQKFDALQQQLGMFNPAIGMIGEMTGGKYQPSLAGISNPVKVQATLADLAAGDPYQRTLDKIPADDQTAALNAVKSYGYDTTSARQGLLDMQHQEAARRKQTDLGGTAAARIRGRK